MLKIPGAQHPAWPWKGMVHVRGGGDDGGGDGGGDEDEYNTQSLPYSGNGETILDTFLLKNRKAKGNQVQIIESESILHQITTKLNITQIAKDLKAYDDDKLQPPPPVLRIPTRHFESGKKLQARISPELKTLRRGHEASKTHPAITYAYDSIQTGSSAFDKTTCESTAWAQKYAPSSAERVLQSGPEAKMLRDWLVTLRVQAVDTGTVDSSTKPKAGAVMAKGKNKRKKKLDGFVVSSDEEDELDEIPDLDGEMLPSGSQSNAKKTLVRSSRQGSRDGGRLANAVVLSGPSGCGKTATVYAIAKELDFEVFEINPSSRRNGKDVLEKVGDMTRNHLVQHRHKEDALQEGAATEDEVDRDLKSGKQGTMTTFFKPKTAPPAGASAAPPTRKTTKTPVEESSSDAKDTKKPAKSQKQSLILLEEVDVLYEEDKQFWATIASMIVQSKRPFVMTCNDEALVPLPMLQSLPLQGIFRFSSPPKDPAVDLLLLIAANEGHALRRHAAETLYDSRGHDLRASITELNFWCQIGVGDMKGGFNWFYPRFPKGKDVDEKGDTIRVVSQDTYQAGMGWLSRDSVADDSPSRSVEEELHQQIGQNWSLDIFDTHQNDSRHHDDFASWVVASSAQCSHRSQNQTILESLDSFSSSLSEADIIGQADFVTMSNQKVMDASIPDLPAKVREDFIIGQQLLEVSPLTRYNTTSADISTTLKSLSRAHTRENSVPSAFEPLDETKATTKLEHYFDESLKEDAAINRLDYCRAFDPIAASEKTMAAGYIDPSVFDGTMKTITLDIAPYVRSIVSFDQRLQRERLQRSSLLSEGGQPGKKKRMRTTRAAYSALEGGTRASTRREKYFSADINPHFVMHTGGKGWDAIAAAATVSPAVASKDATSTRGDAEEVDELADELADEKFD
ncbi:hypothetical protein F4819DRAFT_476294 [Hypoxylon fuscum]|nr:hypothetical protein F4819DRAFT_476294 [Hypoxylon fuscum]